MRVSNASDASEVSPSAAWQHSEHKLSATVKSRAVRSIIILSSASGNGALHDKALPITDHASGFLSPPPPPASAEKEGREKPRPDPHSLDLNRYLLALELEKPSR